MPVLSSSVQCQGESLVLSGQLLGAGVCRREELHLGLECLMLQSLFCEKLNEFSWFRRKPRSEAGASSHSCWVPSASHSTLVGLSGSQYLLSSPSLPQMSSLLEKILYFLSCLVLKVTRTGVEHLRLAGEKGHLENGSRGPRNRGMQGTPSSHHSSPSAVLLEPPRVPRYTPAKASVQPRHPARYISLLPSCEAAAPIPRGEVAWGAGYFASGR